MGSSRRRLAAARAVRKQNGERQGGVVARSPGDGEWAAELQVWLKADAIQLKEGETLQAWPDASGRGNHWKVPTVEAPPREAPAPEWIADSRVHGKPALRFEGPSRLAVRYFPCQGFGSCPDRLGGGPV